MKDGHDGSNGKRPVPPASELAVRRTSRSGTPTPSPAVPIVAYAVDEVAVQRALDRKDEAPLSCDVCGEPVAAEQDRGGLYIWSHQGEASYEEPPVCDQCGAVLGMSLLRGLRIEEEG